MRTMEMAETGRETANQEPQSSWGSMALSAMRFCGLAMGEAAPPIFELSAIPSSNAFDMSLSDGRFRRIG